MAYLGEVQVVQARGFAELVLEGEEGRERNQARAKGRQREGKGESGMICWKGRKIDMGAGKEKEQLSGDVRV